VKVEFGADRFSVMATAQWGFGANSSGGQAHPSENGRLRVERAYGRLSLRHEESHRSEDDRGGSSPTTIMVPF